RVRGLFGEYADSLGVDLCFQGFEDELAGLPGRYAAPGGCVLLAWAGSEPVGCVALRPVDAERAEMKRLYLRPAARGLGVGRQLVERICERARGAGYRWVCLDTLPGMTAAAQLYRSMGFVAIEPYVFNPIRSEEHTSELQSRENLVCRLLLEKKKQTKGDQAMC